MSKRGVLRILAVLAAAFGFGVIVSLFKGNYAGLRGGIGNLAAPWVLLPMAFAARAARDRPWRGAVIGLGTTLVALSGFYLTNLFVLQISPHGSLHDVAHTLAVNAVWFKVGVVSGPIVGALGVWAIRRGRFTVAAIGAAVVLFEPLAVYLYLHLRLGGVFAPGNSDWKAAYAFEAVVGVAAAALLWKVHGRWWLALRRWHPVRPDRAR